MKCTPLGALSLGVRQEAEALALAEPPVLRTGKQAELRISYCCYKGVLALRAPGTDPDSQGYTESCLSVPTLTPQIYTHLKENGDFVLADLHLEEPDSSVLLHLTLIP